MKKALLPKYFGETKKATLQGMDDVHLINPVREWFFVPKQALTCWEHCVKYGNFIYSPGVEILCKGTVIS